MKGGARGHGKAILWVFLGGAALASVWFYREFVFFAERLIYGSDMLFEGISLRRFYVDEIRAGRGVPLWIPHVYGGMPFVALLPGPIFYPTTLLYLLMPLHRAIGWTFVLHTFLSGAFAYFMARSFRLRPSSAVVCGVSFMFTGYVTSHLFGGHDGRMFAMTLIPLAIGSLQRGLDTGEAHWFGALALVVAMQIFTPHMQVMYFSCLALSLFLLFHLLVRVPRAPEGGRRGAYARPLAGFALALLAAIAIGGLQLFPTLALLDDATRAATERGYEFAASYALPPQELTALFLPDLVSSLPGRYWGQNPLKLHTEYLGAVPLALALFAIASAFRPGLSREHRRVIGFLVVASLLGVLFALGAATPVHRLAYVVLPMIRSLRAPAMMLGPVSVFIALLAGFGWEAAAARRETPGDEGPSVSWVALALLAGPVLLLGVVAAVNPRGLLRFVLLEWYPTGWPREPDPALVPALRANGMLLLGGFGLAWGVALAVSRRKVSELALVLVVLFAVADLWRVDSRYLEVRDAGELEADSVLTALTSETSPGERVWAPALAGSVPNYRPNRLIYHGVSSATGRQKFLLRPFARLVGGIQPDEGLLRYPALLGLLDVRYLITPGVQNGLDLVAEAGGRYLYRLPDPPHAFFPVDIAVVDDTAEALARTRSNPDPMTLTVVEASSGREPPAPGRGRASIVGYEPDRIELGAEVELPGLLAVSEIFHPGWRAYVDDEEVPVWRVNVAFRGVEVPAGTHRITFEYDSRSYRLGFWLSMLTMIGVGVVMWLSWRRSRLASKSAI